MWAGLLLAGAVASAPPPGAEAGVQSMLNEESPDVFLAKATLQQYLSRVVRKDWEAARRLTHPKALGVWVCTDDRRSLTVDSTAPGAVSSDLVSGQCQVAGSTLAHDGVNWTAKVSVGAVEPPSKLPWLIGALVLVAIVAGGVWLLRARRGQQPRVVSPPLPPAPPVH